MKNRLFFLGIVLVNILVISAIIYAFLPIAKWYMNERPLWGVDFTLLTTLANLLKNNLVVPFEFWNYAWFGGWPIFVYPTLHAYLLYFIAGHFDLMVGTQILMMASTLLFILGSYFLFFVLSRNPFLSVILALATAFSSGIYQTLTWAGSLPSFATQAAFPWSLFCLCIYFNSNNFRYLLAAALIAGISIWGHPLVFMIYIVPAFLILTFTRFKGGLAIFKKIRIASAFIFLSLIIGLPLFASTFKNALSSAVQTDYGKSALSTTSGGPSQTEIEIAKFNKAQLSRVVSDNHIAPFLLLSFISVLFLISLISLRRKNSLFAVLPFFLMALYFIFYIWLFAQGISIYHGGWYRLFWSVPIWIGALASILYRETFDNFSHFLKNRVLYVLLLVGCNAGLIALGVTFLYRDGAKSAITQIIYRSQVSSAHPDIVNLKISDIDRKELKEKMIPNWLNGDETNWRLYDSDQTVNLWWNSLYKMPLARGYLDPPLTNVQRGYLFWLDAALSETDGEPQLVKVFKYPLETAVSNALFLIDWNAIGYYEGGHVGAANKPVPSYLEKELISKKEVLDFSYLRYTKRPVTLNYYEIKNDKSSPILSATNASTVGIFASDGGYETVVRALAERDNINSQKLISIKLGRFLDEYDLKTLKVFDALYLYDYDYKKEEKTFKMLTEYVKSGKKVFVETGVEVKQSEGSLPEFFPVKMVKRKGQGKQWNLEPTDNVLNNGIDFKSFSPPVFDDDEWKTSSASSDDIRNGAVVILKNQGRVVLASQKLGSGEVIWTGLNFAYHVSRNHNQEEAKLFNVILSSLVDISQKPSGKFAVNFKNANNRAIKFSDARGILFKEQAYPGWSAKITSEDKKSKNLRIFKAGPTYPGYMYIPSSDSTGEVKLAFSGSTADRIQFYISVIVVILLLDEVLLHGLILGRFRRQIFSKLTVRVGKWWEKEEEE